MDQRFLQRTLAPTSSTDGDGDATAETLSTDDDDTVEYSGNSIPKSIVRVILPLLLNTQHKILNY